MRTRVLAKAAARADKALAKAALPEGLTLHALRRTFGSVLIALGHDAAYVMAQMGHTSATMTLGLYPKSIRPKDRERLRALAEGQELALAIRGTRRQMIPPRWQSRKRLCRADSE